MKSADRKKYRTEIPNIIDDSDLSVYAFRLYVHIKRVAGDSGQCWEGSQTLAKACKMSVGKVSDAKQELVSAGLIILTPGDWKKGKADTITVVDVWESNHKTFSSGEKVDENQPETFSPHESTFSPHEPKKEPYKKEDSSANAGPSPDSVGKEPTEHQKMFEAICHCVGWDYKVIDKSQKGQIAQTLGILKDAGYELDDLRKFYRWWFNEHWIGKDKGQHPTLKQLRADIGKVRANGQTPDVMKGGSGGNGKPYKGMRVL